MARTLYGGSPADVIATVTSDDGDLAPYVGTLTAWDSLSGGAQLTNLTTTGGSAITVVTSDSVGRVVFYGPDPYTAPIWLEDGNGYRWRIDPADLAFRTGPAGKGVSSLTIDGSGHLIATYTDATTQDVGLAVGASGSIWRDGAGTPSTGLGAVGDWYNNTTTGDVYEKTGVATYTLRGNLLGGTVALAGLPAGTTLTVYKSGGTWPARPTSRTDITVNWVGVSPGPTIVASGTGGAIDGKDFWDAI